MTRREPRNVPAQWTIDVENPLGRTRVVVELYRVESLLSFKRWVVLEKRYYEDSGVGRDWRHFTRGGALNRVHWLVAHSQLSSYPNPATVTESKGFLS